jgi:hypothetical protein
MRNPTKDSKLKLFSFSTKSTNITPKYTQTDRKKTKRSIKRRQLPQNSISSAEQSAIINAIYSTASYNQKRVLIADSLSTIIAVSDRKRSKNRKTQLIRELINQASTNITLLWVPSHVGMDTWKH